MPAANRLLKNFAAYVDGRGYIGQAEEVKLPDLDLITEEYRGGGMDAPIDIELGQTKMVATCKLSGFEPAILKLWGVGEGQTVPLVFRGALESLDGSTDTVVATCRGKIKTVAPDASTPGSKGALMITMPLIAYTYVHNGETLVDIDVLNMKRVIGGVDRLAAQRRALGIGGGPGLAVSVGVGIG